MTTAEPSPSLRPGGPEETAAALTAGAGGPERPADAPGGPGGKAARDQGGGRTLNVFSHAFLVLWAVMAAGPLLWAVMNSFKSSGAILEDPWSLPGRLNWENWSFAWNEANIGQYTINSVIVVLGSVVGTMLLGSMVAYVLARYDFPGNRLVYFLFVGGMAFPIIVALVPLFFVMKNFALLDTYHGLILVYIAYSLPFTVFFMAAFFRTLPTSIAEAAEIDGASHSRIFFQVMLPMAKPGLISVGIFNFLGQWNQYLIPQVVHVGDADKYVLTQGLANLAAQTGYRGNWGGLFAGLTLAVLPILVVYIVFQRQVQAGLTAGALK
ncbi:carbohydrate ABC transporter permease [Streptomyces sp. DH37]|uniref:carbohydrate ABC transporter permease n=1 Tax=Streptomyces sp. DH37 TaxID=3040122 RepID=UPI0024421C1A|nr:carbohydrate ABC transporter permease [Streptomyces sp. DH37]MDG9705450.1 carbohydrate ABC transporter permease [Streptomyces sp. DH37]